MEMFLVSCFHGSKHALMNRYMTEYNTYIHTQYIPSPRLDQAYGMFTSPLVAPAVSNMLSPTGRGLTQSPAYRIPYTPQTVPSTAGQPNTARLENNLPSTAGVQGGPINDELAANVTERVPGNTYANMPSTYRIFFNYFSTVISTNLILLYRKYPTVCLGIIRLTLMVYLVLIGLGIFLFNDNFGSRSDTYWLIVGLLSILQHGLILLPIQIWYRKVYLVSDLSKECHDIISQLIKRSYFIMSRHRGSIDS